MVSLSADGPRSLSFTTLGRDCGYVDVIWKDEILERSDILLLNVHGLATTKSRSIQTVSINFGRSREDYPFSVLLYT